MAANEWVDVPLSEKKEEQGWVDVPVSSSSAGPVPAAPAAPGVIESAARGVVQGATFNFADEIAGGVEGGLNFLRNKVQGRDTSLTEEYKKSRDESRAAFKAAEEANPVASLAGQLAGGVASAAIPGLGAAGSLSKLAAVGAAQGAAAGLGASEAKDAEGLLTDVTKGAVIGASVPAALKGIQKVVPGLRGSSAAANKAAAKVAGVVGGLDEQGQALYKEMLSNPDKHLAVRNAVKAIKGANLEGEQGLEELGDLVQGMHKNIKAAAQNAYSDTLKAGTKAATEAPGAYLESRVNLLKQVSDIERLIPTSKKDPFYSKALVKTTEQVRGFLTGADPLTKAAGTKGKEAAAQALAEAPLRARQAVDTTLSALRAKGETSGFVVERLKDMRNLLDQEVKSLPGMAEMDALYGKYKEVSKVLSRNTLDRDGNVNLKKLEGFLFDAGGAGAQGQRAKDWQTLSEFVGREDFASIVGKAPSEALGALAEKRQLLGTSKALSRLGAETGATTGRSLAPILVGSSVGGPAGVAAGALSKALMDPAGYLKSVGVANDLLLNMERSTLAKWLERNWGAVSRLASDKAAEKE